MPASVLTFTKSHVRLRKPGSTGKHSTDVIFISASAVVVALDEKTCLDGKPLGSQRRVETLGIRRPRPVRFPDLVFTHEMQARFFEDAGRLFSRYRDHAVGISDDKITRHHGQTCA